jgi:myo-inositol 2-dehydrogenase/D-chiro-inositol 1-dehydrogenase
MEDALDAGGIDAVIIATPGPFHEAVLLPALEAGVEILCEKPLTPDSGSALRILEAEQRLGRLHIQVGFMRRFDPEYVRLREVVASGDLGELLMLHGAHRNASTPPGYVESMLITDSVVHEIDVMPWLVGSPVAAVEVKKTRRNSLAPAGLHEPQLVLLETASGVLADVEINVNSQFGYQVTTDAVFEQGLVQIGRSTGPVVWQGGRGTMTEHMTYTSRFAPAYDLEVERWVAAARAGTIDGPSAWDGYAAAAVCEAALLAQSTGRRVEVEYAPRPAFYGG